MGKEHKVSVKNATDKCQKRTQQTDVRKEHKRQGNVTDWPLQLNALTICPCKPQSCDRKTGSQVAVVFFGPLQEWSFKRLVFTAPLWSGE